MHELADYFAFAHALFIRAVVYQLRARPDQRQLAGKYAGEGLAGGDAAGIIHAARLDLRALLGEALPEFGQRSVGSLAFGQPARGNRKGAVPKLIESGRQLLDDGARSKHVVVGELRFRIDLEVLVADISAADERDGIVDDHQLVVHAIVE